MEWRAPISKPQDEGAKSEVKLENKDTLKRQSVGPINESLMLFSQTGEIVLNPNHHWKVEKSVSVQPQDSIAAGKGLEGVNQAP